jgi:hypothetical protein
MYFLTHFLFTDVIGSVIQKGVEAIRDGSFCCEVCAFYQYGYLLIFTDILVGCQKHLCSFLRLIISYVIFLPLRFFFSLFIYLFLSFFLSFLPCFSFSDAVWKIYRLVD